MNFCTEFFELSPDAMSVSTVEGKPITCNKAFLDLFKISSKEDFLNSTTLNMFVDPSIRQAFYLPRILKDKQIKCFEALLRTNEGNTFLAELTTKLLEKQGKQYLLTITRDITRVSTLQDQLIIYTQEMEAKTNELKKITVEANNANKFKSQFLANMAHEIRTPLNGIIGFTQLTIHKLKKCNIEQYKTVENLEKIDLASHYLLKIINDILDISKVESGRMDIHLDKLYLNSMIENVLTLSEPIARKKNIELIFHPTEESDKIVSDEILIKRIMFNLISNGIKYTKDGGKVSIYIERQDHGMNISVSDNGIGISETDQEKIFEDFSRINSEYVLNQEGTGLGLSLTKRLVTLLNGEISFKSVLGNGTTFYVFLPDNLEFDNLLENEDVNHEKSFQLENFNNNFKVLVIDANDLNTEVIKEAIHEFTNYVVYSTKLGQDGMKQAILIKPDIILLEPKLPDIDGFLLSTQLKLDENTKDIPIIGFVPSLSNKYIMDLKKFGLSGFIEKPINNIESLINTINSVLTFESEI